MDNNTRAEIAAIYNMTDNTFKPFHITEHPFCSAQTLLPNGQGVIVGGMSPTASSPAAYVTSRLRMSHQYHDRVTKLSCIHVNKVRTLWMTVLACVAVPKISQALPQNLHLQT